MIDDGIECGIVGKRQGDMKVMRSAAHFDQYLRHCCEGAILITAVMIQRGKTSFTYFQLMDVENIFLPKTFPESIQELNVCTFLIHGPVSFEGKLNYKFIDIWHGSNTFYKNIYLSKRLQIIFV